MANTALQAKGVGVFTDRETLEKALHQLQSEQFPLSQVSVIAKEADAEVEGTPVTDHVGEQKVESATGVVTDAVRGATWGSLLLGLTGLAIPGVGPILAAGSVGVALLTGLAGTGLGVLNFNNLASALTKLGISEEEARAYGDHLSRGDYLVIVEGTPEQMQQAGTALGQCGIRNWSIYPVES